MPVPKSLRLGGLKVARHWRLVLLLGAGCAAALALCLHSIPRGVPGNRAALISAFGPIRVGEGRLVGFEHAPPGELPGRRKKREAAPVIREILRAAEEHPSPEALGNLALLRILEGKPEQAVALLERATADAPHDARLLSDLSAAALATHKPHLWLLALEAAGRACRADPDLAEARFNLALSLERLELVAGARREWTEYLRGDRASPWAHEARRHAALLAVLPPAKRWEEQRRLLDACGAPATPQQVARVVLQFSEESREHAEEELLGGWAAAESREQSDLARRKLAAARCVARVFAEVAGDLSLTHAVAVIRRTFAAGGSPRLRQALIEGQLRYRRGRQLHRDERAEEATRSLRLARAELARAGSPLALWAELFFAVNEYRAQGPGVALEALALLKARPQLDSYPLLAGRVHWIEGLCHVARGEPMAARDSYLVALQLFEASHAAGEAAQLHGRLAETHRYLGDLPQAWHHFGEALSRSSSLATAGRLQAILDGGAEGCEQEGKLEAALCFRDEVVAVTQAEGEPVGAAHALLRRSALHERLHEVSAARRDLSAARRFGDRIADPASRARIEADLAIAEGELERTRAAGRAIVALRRAFAFYERAGNRFMLARIDLALARASLAMGDASTAREVLRAGIERFERQRARIDEEPFRVSFFERSRALFDTMIRLEAEAGASAEAFDYAERQRARSLLDRLGPGLPREARKQVAARSAAPLPARELIRRLPDGVAVVHYTVLEDRLLAWVVRKGGLYPVEISISAADLAALVDRLRDTLSSGEAWKAPASNLYDRLIRPVSPWLQPSDALVLVPDGCLHRLPFAALYDARKKMPLIAERTLSLAPSATFYLTALERELRLARPGEPRALVVGNPVDEDTADLPGAQTEAEAIAGLYQDPVLLHGERATRGALLANLGGADLFHLASHAAVNQQFPLLSFLRLAPETADVPGTLYAYELYGLRLERPRLAVLAACESGVGPAGGEGALSLGRAFLAAGVPAVIVSQWKVPDAETAVLFCEFHRRLRAGEGVAQALRGAQLALKGRRDSSLRSPATWAAFQLVGASPRFSFAGDVDPK